MTKNELAGKVAESAGLGVGQAKTAVDAVFDAIAAQLASGGEVSVAGFGKFGHFGQRLAAQTDGQGTQWIHVGAAKARRAPL